VSDIELSYLDNFMFVDPAGKPKPGDHLKKSRSRQAIVVIAADWLNRYFVRLSWAGRLPASKFTDKIISVYKDFLPRLCGIEANAMQELYAEMVIDKAREKLEQISMYPVYQPTKVEKTWRIRNILEPVINEGRLFIPDGMPDLEAEIHGFPTAQHRDLVDALASAISIAPRRARQKQENDEAVEVLRYLRETGAPVAYIEQRKKELSLESLHGRPVIP
jgi:hypothetical protein